MTRRAFPRLGWGLGPTPPRSPCVSTASTPPGPRVAAGGEGPLRGPPKTNHRAMSVQSMTDGCLDLREAILQAVFISPKKIGYINTSLLAYADCCPAARRLVFFV